ncbi:MAG: DUF1343 domain-containing protein [Acidobacteriia bacterium]|nr:DUF1343 domain-containing protein [Terriglobia bacterium]
MPTGRLNPAILERVQKCIQSKAPFSNGATPPRPAQRRILAGRELSSIPGRHLSGLGIWFSLLGLLLLILLPTTSTAADVQTGLEVLIASDFSQLQGRRIGLITNQSGINHGWTSTIDLLSKAPGVKLVALFSPEHGIRGVEDRPVPSTVDERTGLPVYSLYSEKQKRPTDEMLQGIDTLVYDIQDVGTRFYTFSTTLAYTMEAAAQHHLKYVVLDRPDPITGLRVEGPALDTKHVSFVGYFPGMPIRHGMTVGELAQMFNEEKKIGADLVVIQMRGWRRWQWYDETGLPWVHPSPNMRNMNEALLYPAVAVLEGANVSVGRGTDTPFELFGAPWIDGIQLAKKVLAARVAGLRVYPIRFTPSAKPFANEHCGGIFLMVVERDSFDTGKAMLALVSALQQLYPGKFQIEKILPLLGSEALLQQLKDGAEMKSLHQSLSADEDRFKKIREKYLIYK